MILTIKGADFSAANIGTLNTVSIRKVIGRGVVHSIPNFVEKGSSVNWTITLNEDYEFGSYAITMGGEVVNAVVDGSVMTISIANVTGAISISVATTYVGVAEPEQPDMPDVPDTPTPEEPTPEPEDPDTPTESEVLMFVNGVGRIVNDVKDMQFTIGKSIGGGSGSASNSHTIGNTVGRAASVGYWLKVNGGETISLNQCIDGKTIYYSTVAMDSNTDVQGNQSNEAFCARKWVTDSLTFPTTTKYVQISLKNDAGTVEFTPEEIAIIKNNITVA